MGRAKLLAILLLGCSLCGCYREQRGKVKALPAKVLTAEDFFPQKKFTKVVAYTFNSGLHYGDPDMHYTVYNPDSNKLAYTLKDSITLTNAQTDTLLSIVNDTSSYVCCAFACFDPHHAFVFYNADTVTARCSFRFSVR